MEIIALDAEERVKLGKNDVKKLRAIDIIPGIVYGSGDPIPVKVPLSELRKIFKGASDKNAIIELNIKTESGQKKETVISHDLARDAISQQLIHVDFLKIDINKPISTSISLKFVGEAPGVKQGGIIIHHEDKLDVTCLPKDIIEYIEVDVSELELDQSINLKDITIPASITVNNEEDTSICHIEMPKVQEEVEEPVEDVEGEEGAEEGSAEEGGEEASGDTDSGSEEKGDEE